MPSFTRCPQQECLSAYWRVMHCSAAHYPENPSKDDKKNYWSFLLSIGKVIPCKDTCGVHWIKVLKNKNIKRQWRNITASRSTFFQFIFDIHNAWNCALSKPMVPWVDAVAMYGAENVRYDETLQFAMGDFSVTIPKVLFPDSQVSTVDVAMATTSMASLDLTAPSGPPANHPLAVPLKPLKPLTPQDELREPFRQSCCCCSPRPDDATTSKEKSTRENDRDSTVAVGCVARSRSSTSSSLESFPSSSSSCVRVSLV
jgi:hypothetical protein